MFTTLLVLASLVSNQGIDNGSNWMAYNRTLAGDRFSPLKEITTANVGKLKSVASFETYEKVSFQTSPVVVDGTMFLTTYRHTYAINASSGQLIWKDVADVKMTGLGNNRGVAFADGTIFRGYSDGCVVAIDASSGVRLWKKQIADPTNGETMPAAPIAWGGMVFLGNAGGENRGVTGRMVALDAKTGEQVWKFENVPTTGPASDTWENKNLAPAGGGTWSTYSIDTKNGVLFASVGNPAPDFDSSLRPGQNLYTNCLLSIDAKTGVLLSYVQPTKNDTHDWDLAAAPALFTSRAGKKIAAVAGKDGMLYGINIADVTRDGGVLPIFYSTPVTWRFNVDAPLSSEKATRFAPGAQGGIEWNGPAYDPGYNLIFTAATDWPGTVKLASKSAITAVKNGQGWSGADDSKFGKMDKSWGGYVTAVDADSGSVAWKYKAPAPIVAAITPTAGGLVFCADVVGTIKAFDSKTGKILWSKQAGRPCGGGIVSYSVDGRQYIAVVAGSISPLWPDKKPNAGVLIYRLP